MSKNIDLFYYLKDRIIYGNYEKSIFWFKKHKGLDWNKGQNFGDYLSVVITGELLRDNDLNFNKYDNVKNKILGIGSVLHFANNNDIIWGSGINGKVPFEKHTFENLDVRMTRGPLTSDKLFEMGISCPENFGDPALLLPSLRPDLKRDLVKNKVIMLPNLNEMKKLTKIKIPKGIKLVSPINYWKYVVEEILTSELVITSSLHGLILSEVYNVPAKFVKPFGGETFFKYEDYYEGTGRILNNPKESFLDSINFKMGVNSSEPIFNPDKMIKSFPIEFFT